MSATHTAGPWYVAGDPHPKAKHPEARKFAFFANRYVATGPELDDEGTHAVVCSMMDGPEQVANAALIAAAPELLAALEACFESGQLTPLTPNTVRKARAAIAKARGQA